MCTHPHTSLESHDVDKPPQPSSVDNDLDGQTFDLRRVILQLQRLLCAIDMQMGVESRHDVDPTLVADSEVIVLECRGEERRVHRHARAGIWHAEDFAHDGQVVRAKTSQEAAESSHERRNFRVACICLADQLVGLQYPLVVGSSREVGESLREGTRLIYEGGVGANDISDAGEFNVLDCREFVEQCLECARVSAHVRNKYLSL